MWKVVATLVLALAIAAFALLAYSLRHREDNMASQRAQAQLRVLVATIELFRKDTGHLPVSLKELTRAADAAGPYVRESALTDPWGTAFFYHSGQTGDFVLFSLGSDVRLGGHGDAADIQLTGGHSG